MFVSNPFSHEARVMREIRTLAEAGQRVTVVAAEGDGLPQHESGEGFETWRVPAISRLTLAGRRAAAALRGDRAKGAAEPSPRRTMASQPPFGGRRFARLWDSGHTLAVRLLKPANLVRWWGEAYRAVRKRPAGVWLAHDLDTLPLAYLASRRLGGRLVYDSHELWADRNADPAPTAFVRWACSRVEAMLARRSDAVMTVNDSIAGLLAQRYGIERPAVVRNVPRRAEAHAAHDLRGELGIPRSRRVLLYLGRLTPNRGLEPLIEAMADLEDRELVTLGGGVPEYAARLEELARDRGVSDRVHLVPPVDAEAVVSWAQGADIGLATIQNAGLSYYYSLPNKLFQYLAAGLPIVGSDFPELKAIIVGEDVGVTCDPDDAADIARAVRAVTDDPGRYEQLRSNAAAAAARHTWESESPVFLEACLGETPAGYLRATT